MIDDCPSLLYLNWFQPRRHLLPLSFDRTYALPIAPNEGDLHSLSLSVSSFGGWTPTVDCPRCGVKPNTSSYCIYNVNTSFFVVSYPVLSTISPPPLRRVSRRLPTPSSECVSFVLLYRSRESLCSVLLLIGTSPLHVLMSFSHSLILSHTYCIAARVGLFSNS